jgi:hypothetical protein
MAAGQPDEFAARRPTRRAHGGPGERRLILVADEDEKRAGYAGCEAAGSVEGQSEGGAGGDLLLPVRVPVAGVERSVAIEGIRCRESRDRSRLAGEQYQQGAPAGDPSEGVEDARAVKRSIASGFW